MVLQFIALHNAPEKIPVYKNPTCHPQFPKFKASFATVLLNLGVGPTIPGAGDDKHLNLLGKSPSSCGMCLAKEGITMHHHLESAFTNETLTVVVL